MDQESETKVEKKGSKTWLWVVIVIVVIVAGLAIWYFTRSDDSDTASTATEEAAAFVPQHADWQLFTSSNYKIKLYHPADYTVTESAVGNLMITKGSVEMADIYVVAANGSPNILQSQINSFTNDSMGLMTGGSEVDTTAAGMDVTMVSGTLGKNAGISQTHAGERGSMVSFIKNDLLFTFDSYWNGDTVAFDIYKDMTEDLRF